MFPQFLDGPSCYKSAFRRRGLACEFAVEKPTHFLDMSERNVQVRCWRVVPPQYDFSRLFLTSNSFMSNLSRTRGGNTDDRNGKTRDFGPTG